MASNCRSEVIGRTFISGQIPGDEGPDRVSNGERKPLPHPRDRVEAPVRGTEVRQILTMEQHVLVLHGHGIEAPMTLEVVSTCAHTTATEVEDAVAAAGGEAHEFPVHEVIDRERQGFTQRPTVVWEHLVLEQERQDTCDQMIASPDG